MPVSRNEGGTVQPVQETSTITPTVYYPVTPLEQSSLPPPVTPANWYPDPVSPGVLRYWDGVRWTEHRQAATPAATATVYNNVHVSSSE